MDLKPSPQRDPKNWIFRITNLSDVLGEYCFFFFVQIFFKIEKRKMKKKKNRKPVFEKKLSFFPSIFFRHFSDNFQNCRFFPSIFFISFSRAFSVHFRITIVFSVHILNISNYGISIFSVSIKIQSISVHISHRFTITF